MNGRSRTAPPVCPSYAGPLNGTVGSLGATWVSNSFRSISHIYSVATQASASISSFLLNGGCFATAFFHHQKLSCSIFSSAHCRFNNKMRCTSSARAPCLRGSRTIFPLPGSRTKKVVKASRRRSHDSSSLHFGEVARATVAHEQAQQFPYFPWSCARGDAGWAVCSCNAAQEVFMTARRTVEAKTRIWLALSVSIGGETVRDCCIREQGEKRVLDGDELQEYY